MIPTDRPVKANVFQTLARNLCYKVHACIQGRATDIVGQGLQQPQHNHHHMQTSRSPRRSPCPHTTDTGTDPHVPFPNPAEHSPEAVAPARGYSGTPSQMSLPSSQREFVSEEKCRTADGNVNRAAALLHLCQHRSHGSQVAHVGADCEHLAGAVLTLHSQSLAVLL